MPSGLRRAQPSRVPGGVRLDIGRERLVTTFYRSRPATTRMTPTSWLAAGQCPALPTERTTAGAMGTTVGVRNFSRNARSAQCEPYPAATRRGSFERVGGRVVRNRVTFMACEARRS